MNTAQRRALTFLILMAALFLNACTPQAGEVARADQAENSAGTSRNVTVEFFLRTAMVDGHIVYIGSGGDLEGVVNPDLIVQAGDVVRVALSNTDGMSHDLFLPDWSIRTSPVMKIGERAEIIFEVGDRQPGVYVYYCTFPATARPGRKAS